jgi:hypothetical protein
VALGDELSKHLNIYQCARYIMYLTNQRVKSGKMEGKSCVGNLFLGSWCHVRFKVLVAMAICIYTILHDTLSEKSVILRSAFCVVIKCDDFVCRKSR